MNFQDCDAKHVASDCLFLAVAIQVPLSTAATSDAFGVQTPSTVCDQLGG